MPEGDATVNILFWDNPIFGFFELPVFHPAASLEFFVPRPLHEVPGRLG
jgi:hypothetical protein